MNKNLIIPQDTEGRCTVGRRKNSGADRAVQLRYRAGSGAGGVG